jgi:hypothetical protein
LQTTPRCTLAREPHREENKNVNRWGKSYGWQVYEHNSSQTLLPSSSRDY